MNFQAFEEARRRLIDDLAELVRSDLDGEQCWGQELAGNAVDSVLVSILTLPPVLLSAVFGLEIRHRQAIYNSAGLFWGAKLLHTDAAKSVENRPDWTWRSETSVCGPWHPTDAFNSAGDQLPDLGTIYNATDGLREIAEHLASGDRRRVEAMADALGLRVIDLDGRAVGLELPQHAE